MGSDEKIAKKMNHIGNIDEENEREERNNHARNDVGFTRSHRRQLQSMLESFVTLFILC